MKGIFTRYRLAIFIGLGIIIVLVLFYVLRNAILPFIVGLLLAYILMPFISWAEKRSPRWFRFQQSRRILIILFIYFILLLFIAMFSYFGVMAVTNALQVLANNAQNYIVASFYGIQRWTADIQRQFPPEIQQQVNATLTEAAVAVVNALKTIFYHGISSIPSTVNAILGFAVLPIFLFYILKDKEKLEKGFYSAFSPPLAKHIRGIISVIDKVLGRYVRAQILLAFIVGFLCFIGLMILRIKYAPALASLAGIGELIPVLGPWVGGIVAVIVTLAIDPDKAIWVALLFILVQLLENLILVPRVHGGYLRIHPAIVLVLIIVGSFIGGIWGMILAVPLVATFVELYKYVRNQAEPPQNGGPQDDEQQDTDF